jgi:hypothetical protein
MIINEFPTLLFCKHVQFYEKTNICFALFIISKKIFFAEKGSPTVVLSTVLGKAAGIFCEPVLSFAA